MGREESIFTTKLNNSTVEQHKKVNTGKQKKRKPHRNFQKSQTKKTDYNDTRSIIRRKQTAKPTRADEEVCQSEGKSPATRMRSSKGRK